MPEPHPSLHRARGEAELSGDLGMTHLAEIGERDHLSLSVGQAIKQTTEIHLLLAKNQIVEVCGRYGFGGFLIKLTCPWVLR